MYNVGDRVQFINLKGSSWEKSCATVEKKLMKIFFGSGVMMGKGESHEDLSALLHPHASSIFSGE